MKLASRLQPLKHQKWKGQEWIESESYATTFVGSVWISKLADVAFGAPALAGHACKIKTITSAEFDGACYVSSLFNFDHSKFMVLF